MKKYVLEIGEKEYTAEVTEVTTENVKITINGEHYNVKLKEFGRTHKPMPEIQKIEKVQSSRPAPTPTIKPVSQPVVGDNAGAVYAPLPGLILDVMIKEGDVVNAGQNLILMEAMKMENQIQAPHDGIINKVYVKKGDSIEEEQLLIEISRSPMSLI